MNKTIIININGIVFHIEEDAYEVLRSYMSEVKRHFAYSPDSEEIITDIENRLAEMFNERLAPDNKQVIILQDVQEITAQMGSVADFELNDQDSDYSLPRMDKKLFRDNEDRMIAGVCSGIGHYFDVEARWIRLCMLLFFFAGGSGLMVYVILWIVMPAAKTRTERMSMKGEAINLQNFKRNFDEELENVRHGAARVHQEMQPALNNLGNTLASLFKLFIKIIGAILIFIEAMLLLGLTIGLMVILGFWNAGDIGPLPHIIDQEYRSILAIGIFLTVSIPLIALLLLEIRLLFNRKVLGKTGAFLMLILWLAGLATGVYYGARTGMQFSEEASFSQVTEIKPMPVYYLKLNSEKHLTHQDSIDYNVDPTDFKNRKIINRHSEFDYERNIRLTIELSDTEKPTLTQEFSSRGASFESALKSAKSIEYRFKQTDSVLYFDRTIAIGKNALYRGQELNLILHVPRNTKMVIDQNFDRYMQRHNLWECHSDDDPNKSRSEWIMTESGLTCNADSTFKNQNTPVY